MDSGQYDVRLRIEQSAEVRSTDYNAAQETWMELITVRASVKPLSGRELWWARQVQAQVTHRIRTHYLLGIKEKMRGVVTSIAGDRVFNFLSVTDVDEKHVELEILAIEKK